MPAPLRDDALAYIAQRAPQQSPSEHEIRGVMEFLNQNPGMRPSYGGAYTAPQGVDTMPVESIGMEADEAPFDPPLPSRRGTPDVLPPDWLDPGSEHTGGGDSGALPLEQTDEDGLGLRVLPSLPDDDLQTLTTDDDDDDGASASAEADDNGILGFLGDQVGDMGNLVASLVAGGGMGMAGRAIAGARPALPRTASVDDMRAMSNVVSGMEDVAGQAAGQPWRAPRAYTMPADEIAGINTMAAENQPTPVDETRVPSPGSAEEIADIMGAQGAGAADDDLMRGVRPMRERSLDAMPLADGDAVVNMPRSPNQNIIDAITQGWASVVGDGPTQLPNGQGMAYVLDISGQKYYVDHISGQLYNKDGVALSGARVDPAIVRGRGELPTGADAMGNFLRRRITAF